MEIKTTMRDCLCRIAIIKKTRMNKCQEEYGEKGTLLHSWEYYKMATIIEKKKKKTMKFSSKIKKKKTIQFHNSTLSIHLKKMKTLVFKDICTPLLVTMLLIKAKIKKQPKCPWIDGWMKITWQIYTLKHSAE